ncbi:hypothetical protein GT045_08340 [Streptomyces sp. SID486]|nr:hypothetical protein [Streptomyces sp. SID2955]MYW46906.1 hypothetical protein [Streptomyces sp. SID161]MYX94820.1 hypothetical protein [Streptomyces sp. SID486]
MTTLARRPTMEVSQPVVRPRGATMPTVPEPTRTRPSGERPLWPWVVVAAVAACVLIALVNVLLTA